jgi:hypothetical protein
MRRLIEAMATICAAAVLAGCATITPSSHVDTNVDFSKYHTFDSSAFRPIS